MDAMMTKLIAPALVAVLACSVTGAALSATPSTRSSPEDESVFIGLSTEQFMPKIDVDRGELRIRNVAAQLEDRSGYSADGRVYPLDFAAQRARYSALAVDKRIDVRNGELWFDGKRVALPPHVAIRNVWRAILWKGWVIAIGRTSKADNEATARPPFIAAELLTFSANALKLDVRFLVPQAPSDDNLRIEVLTPAR